MCIGDKFLFVPTGSNIHVLDTENHSVVKSLTGHYSSVNCVAFNTHEQELYSGGNDRNILIWESNQTRNETFNEHLAETERKGGKSAADKGLATTVTVDNWSSSDDDD
jgi:WD40 repeat protein